MSCDRPPCDGYSHEFAAFHTAKGELAPYRREVVAVVLPDKAIRFSEGDRNNTHGEEKFSSMLPLAGQDEKEGKPAASGKEIYLSRFWTPARVGGMASIQQPISERIAKVEKRLSRKAVNISRDIDSLARGISEGITEIKEALGIQEPPPSGESQS